MSDSNLFEQQRRNRRRSAVIVTVFLLFFAWIGFGGDLVFYLFTMPTSLTSGLSQGSGDGYHHTIPLFGIAATLLGIGMAWHGWRNGAKDVLWAAGASELVTPHKPEERTLVNVVEEMAIASGLPKPIIWIVPD